MDPIVKELTLRCHPDHAFDTWTARIGDWWPLADYSLLKAGARTVTIEPELGGRVYEDDGAGATCVWGTVTVWEPKTRLAHTFTPWAGAETVVEISFTALDEGCLVRLVHSGWTDEMVDGHAGYVAGWDEVLGHYARACA